MQKLKDFYKEKKFERLQRRRSLNRRQAEKELTERRLERLQQRILDPNQEENVESALLQEELAIHHNHQIAQQLKLEEHSWLIEMGEFGAVMHEANDPDFLLQENFLEKKKSG